MAFSDRGTREAVIRKKLVGYARIERRRDRRRPTDLSARIGDHAATIVDISLGGVRAADCVVQSTTPSAYRLGDQYRVNVDVPSYGLLELLAEVARIDTAGGSIGLRFVGLDSATYRVIERLAIGRPVAKRQP